MAKSFYENLVSNDFYQEKTASTKESIKGVLDSFSTDEMEAIASELNLISKQAEEEGHSLENRVLNQVQKKEHDDAKDRASEARAEGGQGKTDESQASDSDTSEEGKTHSEKEHMVNPQARAHENNSSQPKDVVIPDAKKEEEHSPEEKTHGEYSEEEKEAMVLQAYDIAFEKLASSGYGLEDYAFTKLAGEGFDEELSVHIANDIAEQAEKLAYVTEQNPLKVADDILGEIFDLADEY